MVYKRNIMKIVCLNKIINNFKISFNYALTLMVFFIKYDKDV